MLKLVRYHNQNIQEDKLKLVQKIYLYQLNLKYHKVLEKIN